MSGAARRGLAAAGGFACAAAIGLSAYAMHGLDGEDSQRASLAAAFLFGHGLAWLVLAPTAVARLRLAGLFVLVAGVALFCGSLLAAVFFDASTALAPTGGILLMLGWLLLAADALRPAVRP
ncbi:DUF423 domain-containing protein [Arenimonas sp. MALMAid1274]|uniref:DUF423 domain-containing protein n=1 Tax=Arenimonas sp. MALMAid1274 TaxID=3411630 RepID=UPI003BA19EED